MANNFFLNNDPLLFNSNFHKPSFDEDEARRQLNDTVLQYKYLQQQQNTPMTRDYLGELDKLTRELGESSVDELNNDEEFQQLNGELKTMIQEELMLNIKWRINSNQNAVRNIEKQTEIIGRINRKMSEKDRKNMNDINDYMKNYSNFTFDEYKKIKEAEKEEKK